MSLEVAHGYAGITLAPELHEPMSHLEKMRVHKRLKDKDTGWKDKVQLAKFAWTSTECYIPNKHQVLTEWISNVLINLNKLEIQDEIKIELWQYFNHVLQSQRSSDVSIGKPVSLKADVAQVLLEELGTCSSKLPSCDQSHLQTVISCCTAIVSSQDSALILTAKYQTFIQFTAAMVTLSVSLLTKNGEMPKDINILLETTLEKYTSLQKQQTNQRQVLTIVCEQLMIPIFKLHFLLNTVNVDSHQRMKLSLENILRSALFHQDHHEALSKYLDGMIDKTTPKTVKTGIEVIDNCMKFVQNALCNGDIFIYNGIPILYKAFLSTERSFPGIKEFTMFQKFCEVIGLSVDLSDCNVRWDHVLNTTHKLLELRGKFELYNIGEDTNSGCVQFHWYRQLLKLLLKHPQSHLVSWFNCIRILLGMNHLILDVNLINIWKCVWIEIEKPDKDVQTSQHALLGELLQTYAKLHQFNKVISSLLKSINSAAIVDAPANLLSGIQIRLSECVQVLSPKLTLDIWKQFIDELSSHYLPTIQCCDVVTVPKKKQKTKKQSSPRTTLEFPMMQKFEFIVYILRTFLWHCKLVEDRTAVILHRIESVMTSMQEDLLKPLLRVCCTTEEVPSSLLCCCLVLYHCWGQIYLLLKHHTKYREDRDINLDTHVEDSHIFHFVNSDQWRNLTAKCKDDDKLEYMVGLLALQKQQILVQYASPSCSTAQQNISHILLHLCNLPGEDSNTDSLTTELWPSWASHWQVLTDYMPLVLPNCTHEQLGKLARHTIHTLLQHPDTHQHRISRTFLKSETFQESVYMQVAVVTGIFHNVVDILNRVSTHSDMSRLLSQLVAKEIPWLQQANTRPRLAMHNKDDIEENYVEKTITLDLNESWLQLQGIASKMNYLLKYGNNEEIELTEVCIKKLNAVLQMLSELPLEHLVLSNQTRCMIGMLLVQHVLQGSASHNTLLSVPLATKCYEIFCRFLHGVHRSVILDFLQSGTLLASLAQSVLSIWQRVNSQSEEVDEVLTNYMSACSHVITQLLQLAYRVQNWTIPLDDFMSKLKLLLKQSTKDVKKQANVDQLQSLSPIIQICSAVLKEISQISYTMKDRVNPLLKIHQRHLTEGLERLLAIITNQHLLEETSNITKVAIVILQVRLGENGDTSTEDNWNIHKSIVNKTILSLKMNNNITKPILSLNIEYLTLICQAKTLLKDHLGEEFLMDVWGITQTLMLQCVQDDDVQHLLDSLLRILLETASIVQLRQIVQESLLHLERSGDVTQTKSTLAVWKIILDKLATKEQQLDIPKEIVPTLTITMVTRLSEVKGEDPVSLLQLLDLLTVKKLLEPKMVLFTLHGCMSVQLDDIAIDEFYDVYSAVYHLINSMFLHYSKIVLTALPSYYMCLSHIL
ncbi:unhealthy ribosome biogenesis protein 2 homolog [Glandiceps talaboti]